MMKKRKLSIITVCLLTILFLTVPVSAKIGDAAGAVYYTDIRASVNGYPIETYQVDGETAVCAEDLKEYGFFVGWYPDLRMLEILLYQEYKTTPMEYDPSENEKLVGRYRMPYLETDIKTFLGGKEIVSWNIDGRTLIRLQDLAVLGTEVWDEDTRTCSITLIPSWTMMYSSLTPPSMFDEKTDIREFDLHIVREEDGQYHMDGNNASYFSNSNVQLNFSASGASVMFSFHHYYDTGLGIISDAIHKCVNRDHRDNLAVEPKADIAELIEIAVNGEAKQIHTVAVTQGNGHIDYILSFDGSYPRENVESVRISCKMNDEK